MFNLFLTKIEILNPSIPHNLRKLKYQIEKYIIHPVNSDEPALIAELYFNGALRK